ncbi:MAG TPA: hypothetical protein VEE84_05195, partial [Burkholderiaceae bacterium]|nr:hypothetical protein [Burkholderiaceae bacterium]
MKLAFWGRKRTRRSAPEAPDAGVEPQFETAEDGETASASALARVRMRRRLIGAAALLLAVVILVPMLLDSTPRAVSDNIPIELPSDKTRFVPRIPTPPPEVSGARPDAAVVPAAPGSAADTAAEAPSAGSAATGKSTETPATPAKKRADPTGDA